MKGRSAAAAGLISGEDMATRLFLPVAKEKPRLQGRGSNLSAQVQVPLSVALAEQLQQEREQVDEVQIERKRAGDGRTLCNIATLRGIAVDVIILQPLRVISGEAGEHQHAHH